MTPNADNGGKMSCLHTMNMIASQRAPSAGGFGALSVKKQTEHLNVLLIQRRPRIRVTLHQPD